MTLDSCTVQQIVSNVLDLYNSLALKLPPAQYTILASIILSQEKKIIASPSSPVFKIISLSTGSKCLPGNRLSPQGDVLNDSHAEVLARRGAIRWFLEEIGRTAGGPDSEWICRESEDKYRLGDGVEVNLYVSTLPCGDASTRYLASVQDQEMAALKDSKEHPPLPPGTASRGRDNYSLYGVLRTKPGRADAAPTLSMSCSDKIAAWNVLGFLGALGSRFFVRPLYLDNIIIGEVDTDAQDNIREDCERAFWKRLEGLEGLPDGYELHRPTIHFTPLPFPHSLSVLSTTTPRILGSCNESLCWIADSPSTHGEVLINGLKRGTSPKHRQNQRFRPQLCKASLFELYDQTLTMLRLPHLGLAEDRQTSYLGAKTSMVQYQMAKVAITGPGKPFWGWVKSDTGYNREFGADGE